jgi:alpha-1,3-rhamnosyl/mannosyltransferase
MRICLDGRTATRHFPGIGRYVSGLAAALARQLDARDRLEVLTASLQPEHWGLHLPNTVGRATIGASPFSVRQQWQVPRLLRKSGAELYHSTFYSMPYRVGIPTVLTVYDLIPCIFPRFFSRAATVMFRLLMSLALRAADRVIAISEATRADLIARLGADPASVVTIPLAPGAAFRPCGSEEVGRVRGRYALPSGYVLYLGSNKPHKNLPRLVEAWGRIKGGWREIALIVAGPRDSRYRDAERLVERFGLGASVFFLGPVPEEDLPGLYSGASCFIFPSLCEGYGLPVIEAMSCGAPVACSRVSSLQEIAGDGAILFDPNAVDSIALSLACLLEDPALREDLRDRGLRQASRFCWEETARRTLQVYRSLA